jgi:hypothetical protein
MRVDRIKKSSIESAEAEVVVTKKELAELEATTATQLWDRELDEFLEAWEDKQASMLAILRASSGSAVGQTGKKKTLMKKIKK